VNPFNSLRGHMTNYPWGKYLGHGMSAMAWMPGPLWSRIAPSCLQCPSRRQLHESQLIKWSIGMAMWKHCLDVNGYVSEASGQTFFVVRKQLLTRHWQLSAAGLRVSAYCPGEDIGLPVVEQMIPAKCLLAMSLLLRHASEITPIRSIDKIISATASPDQWLALQREFLHCERHARRHNWFTPVPVRDRSSSQWASEKL